MAKKGKDLIEKIGSSLGKIDQGLAGGDYFLGAVSQVFSDLISLDQLLELVMDRFLQISGGERGFLVLVDADGHLDFKVARNFEKQDIERPEFAISRKIVSRVVKSGKSLLSQDASQDKRFKNSESVVNLQLKSVICVPLIREGKVLGVTYIDNPSRSSLFSPKDLRLAESLARGAVEAIKLSLNGEKLKRENIYLKREVEDKFPDIIGTNPKLLAVLEEAKQVAPTDAPVIIQGETGTGKELLAKAIHRLSERSQRPFMPVHCGAIPETLLEAELFGSEKGAFTGATTSRLGRFEAADRGTIFLDEISQMSPKLQVKLLRVLQSGEIQRVGSNRIRRVDVRVISATNRDLSQMLKKGTFRKDLYYRVNVINLTLPPLRERRDDLPLLIDHFLKKFRAELRKDVDGFTPQAKKTLLSLDYPGNIRELENIIKRGLILCKGKRIGMEDLPPDLVENQLKGQIPQTNEQLKEAKEHARREAAIRVEKDFLVHLLLSTQGKVAEAARRAGINRSLLHQMLSKHHISPKDFR